MRRLIGLVVVLALLYGGYWAVGAQAVRRGAAAALEQARAEGWGSAEAVTLAGFPSRFDLTLHAPEVRDPQGSLAWRADLAQVFALSYRPQELIVFTPTTQQLRLGGQWFDLTNSDLRASAAVGLAASLPLSRGTLVGKDLALAHGTTPVLAASELRAAIRQAQTDPAPNAYDLGLDLLRLDLPRHWLAQIAPQTDLPARIERLHVDATATLSAPLDRTAPAAPPQIEALSLHAAELDWGGRQLRADGTLSIGPAGQPEGTITFRSKDWQSWLALAEDLGLIAAKQMPMLTGLGSYMAQAQGGELAVPLAFQNGRMSLGPVPLGPAPVLGQRQ